VGVVSLAEAYGTAPQDRACYERMLAEMTAQFAPTREAMPGFTPATHHLLGTSGTVTTLAGVALGLDRYVRAKVDGTWHNCADILRVIDRIVAQDRDGRAAMGCIGPDRADLVVPGCAIFAAIVTLWPCVQLRVADRGLREGILRELVAEGDA
jgi:exopolyphosphatase/guanosine-5'-triphosphate,3'-diphosphate pyrophosphatase